MADSGKELKGEARYELIRELGKGNFGQAMLAKDKLTGEQVAIKFLPRGSQITRHVEREILNHRTLQHPNVVSFREVYVTKTDLCIVMEFAEGGELFKRVRSAKHLSEADARWYFQQIIVGLYHCHKQGVCHRDLKLENILLDAPGDRPHVKIADFGYSKNAVMQSAPNSTVGTPAYIAPEVLLRTEYAGEPADVWSAGVTLYVMLCGRYPFEDPQDPKNFQKTLQRIINVQYTIPPSISLSPPCIDLMKKMLVADPEARITVPEIFKHPFYKKDLPQEVADEIEGKGAKRGGWLSKLTSRLRKKKSTASEDADDVPADMQDPEEIKKIIEEATKAPKAEVDMMDDDFGDDFDE